MQEIRTEAQAYARRPDQIPNSEYSRLETNGGSAGPKIFGKNEAFQPQLHKTA